MFRLKRSFHLFIIIFLIPACLLITAKPLGAVLCCTNDDLCLEVIYGNQEWLRCCDETYYCYWNKARYCADFACSYTDSCPRLTAPCEIYNWEAVYQNSSGNQVTIMAYRWDRDSLSCAEYPPYDCGPKYRWRKYQNYGCQTGLCAVNQCPCP